MKRSLKAGGIIPVFFIIIQTTVFLNAASPHDDEVLDAAIEKGKLAADYWIDRSGVNSSTTNYYADICSFYGVCLFGDALGDSSYFEKINGSYHRNSAILTDNIDHCSCGILPLHLYLHNNNKQQLNLGLAAVEGNIQQQGFVRNAIDDTYMTGSLHVQAYKATQDTRYLDFAVDYLTMYMGNLQQDTGLYWHHKDLAHQFWGRGNGWGAASSAELLRIIPKNHEKYDTFINHYKKHMQGLVNAQWDNGMWPQLLLSEDGRNWEETSGTSMFVFALFTGLELGILDRNTFLEPAKNGWMAVKEYLSNDGKLGNVAEGFWPDAGDANNYLNAPKAAAGNSHGTAGFLWAATGVIRYYNSLTATDWKPVAAKQIKMTIASPQIIRFFDLMGRPRLFSIKYNTPSASAGIIIRNSNTLSRPVTYLH